MPTLVPNPVLWQRLSPLLDELLEAEPAEQTSRLAAVRAEDPVLADEAERWLARSAAAQADEFLGGRAVPVFMQGPLPADSLAGMELGGYTLLEPIGEGGSGSVWRARRSDGRYNATVAIKLLHLSLLGQVGAERFRREGAILARLSHPHIARLLDAGITPGGQPYLVLEFVSGQPIDAWCRERRLDIDARLRLFLSVLTAVGHAHRHLVVHRDLKPGNILVDEEGQVKLLDFGIARLIDDQSEGTEASAMTKRAGVVLTPAYAAPEQFTGDTISMATDVYSLGVLLYGLLTGRHPTPGHDRGLAELVSAVLHAEPGRASTIVASALPAVPSETPTSPPDLGAPPLPAQPTSQALARERASTVVSLRRRLQGDLDTILMCMLRKQPAERYASVDAVAEDIRRHLAHQPIAVRPEAWAYHAVKFARRHRGAVLATALTSLAIVAGVVGTVSQAQRAREQARIAQTERDRALRELTHAEAANQFLGQLLRERWNRPIATTELLAGAERLLQRQFADEPGLRSRMQAMLIDLHVEMNEGQRAQALSRQAEQSARAAGDPVSLAIVHCAQASALVVALDIAGARRLSDSALAVLRPRRDDEAAALATCLVGRSFVESAFGEDPRVALALADEALEVLTPVRSGLRSLQHNAREARADALQKLGRSAEAVATLEAVLAEEAGQGTDRSLVGANRLAQLAAVFDAAGQPLRAAAAQARANDIHAELRGQAALPAAALGNQARFLLQIGEVDAAREHFEAALTKARQDNDVALRGIVSMNYAKLWCDAGDLARCADQVALGHRLLDPLVPPGHPRRANLLSVDAMLAEARGDLPAARAALLGALQVLAGGAGDHALRRGLGWRLARIDYRLGHFDAARSGADAAVAQARAALAGFSHSLPLGQALLLRGQVHAAQGEVQAARGAFAEAIEQLRHSAGSASPLLSEAERLLAALKPSA